MPGVQRRRRMAGDKRGSSSPVPPPQRRRPAPTIDLKATEIASEPVTSTQPIDPVPDVAKSEAQPEAQTAAFEAPAQAAADMTAGPAAPPPSDPPPVAAESPKAAASEAPAPEAMRERAAAVRSAVAGRLASAPLIGAALAGAGATMCVFVVLWAFGAFATRDDLTVTLAARLAIMELQIRDLLSRPQPAGLDQRALAELAARVGAAEQAMGRLSGVETNVSKLETAAAAPRPAVTDQTLAARIAALETALRPLADLPARVDAMQKSASAPAAPTVAPAELAALTARMTALEQAEKAIEQRVARPAPATGTDKAGRVAFVATALRAAVERGDAFAPELAAAKSLAPDGAMLAPLEPFAATGVPRAATLAREFSQIAGVMLAAAGGPREGGLIERLQQNAERLVRIRPVSDAAGDDPAAIVGRADAKATRGDIAGALAEIARLPEGARVRAQGWVRKAEMQVAALAATRRFAETAVGALAGAGQ